MLARTFLGLAATAATCLGASLQQVTNFGNNPTNIQMHIYVPDRVASNPAIIVAVSARRAALAHPLEVLCAFGSLVSPRTSFIPAAAMPSSGSAAPGCRRTPTSTASSSSTPALRT